MAIEVQDLRRQTINSDDAPGRPRDEAVLMEGHRPRVALDISTRLFRDALMRALAPYVEVVVAPDCDTERADWLSAQRPFDVAIVSGGYHVVDVDAELVVEVPPATGVASLGHVRGDDRPVRTLQDLFALLNAE